MKKLAALLLLAAVLYLFMPLSSPFSKKKPKALFLEHLVSVIKLQDGRCEAELELEIPVTFPFKLGASDGKNTKLSLSLSSTFQKKRGQFASALTIKPESLNTEKALTDLVVANGRLYLNLRTLYNYALASNGERLNYSLFFPADYLYFNFNELASLSPETVGAALIGLSLQKSIMEPTSPLSKTVNALLDEKLFSVSDGSYVLTLDSKSFSDLAAALLEDINGSSQEYAKQLLLAAYPDAKNSAPDKSLEALASEIKSWSAKAFSSLNASQDMTAEISISRLSGEQNYGLSFSIEGEKENLQIDCDMRLTGGSPESISVPERAMNATELLGVIPDPKGSELNNKQGGNKAPLLPI